MHVGVPPADAFRVFTERLADRGRSPPTPGAREAYDAGWAPVLDRYVAAAG